MEETIFEMLERTRAVDRLLFWLAVLSPPVIAGLAAWLRYKPVVVKHRHRWVLACLTAPGLLVLWKVYNAVVDHFGLDSILGLFVNVGVFAAAALLFTGLRLVLRAALANVPKPVIVAQHAKSQPIAEFRPYKPAFTEPEPTTGYSARISTDANGVVERKDG